MICEEVGDCHGTAISPGTVQDCVHEGKMGQDPGWNRPNPALLPEETFQILLTAFENHSQCKKINGVSENLHCSDSVRLIQRVLDPVHKAGTQIAHCLPHRSDTGFKVEAALNDEEQRARWTTHGNERAWFDSWKTDLENFGFGLTLKDVSFHTLMISFNRLSTLSLDGSHGSVGGRQE